MPIVVRPKCFCVPKKDDEPHSKVCVSVIIVPLVLLWHIEANSIGVPSCIEDVE